jgi:Stress responsive A/B Barrel Domain
MAKFIHIVLLKFKADTNETEIDAIFRELKSLLDDRKIPGLLTFSGGPYSSPEGLNKGFTHGFTMTFESEQLRDNYFPHPAHEEVKNKILPLIDDVVAFDYQL